MCHHQCELHLDSSTLGSSLEGQSWESWESVWKSSPGLLILSMDDSSAKTVFLAEFGSMGDIQNTHVHKITYIVLCWLVSEGIKLQICADQYNDICIPQYFGVSNLPP